MAGGQRKLAAIVAADVVGYSRLMGLDEDGTILTLKTYRTQIIDPTIAKFHGRIANTAGDSFLAEFASVVDAIKCSIEIQHLLEEKNKALEPDRRLVFRIGINVGDVVANGDDLLGDGVNVAARIEALAEPGGISISRSARDQVRDRLDIKLDDQGHVEVKNIARPVRVFRVAGLGLATVSATESSGTKAAKPKSPRQKLVVLAAVFVGIVAVGSWWVNSISPIKPGVEKSEIASERPSVAVLPFANLSGDPDQAYFSAGITEDITTDLSKVSGLFVASRAATMRFQKPDQDVSEIGKALGVANILTGSLRRSQGKVRITAKLIAAQSGAQIWADRFDRDAQDVFAIQDEIATQVVAQLSAILGTDKLARVKRNYTPNIEAYDLYIQGRAKRIPPTPPNLAAAFKLFDRAIEIDPKFAGGYAGAAVAQVLLSADSNGRKLSSEDQLAKAQTLAEQSVELDPEFGPAWGSLAEVYLRTNRHDDALVAAQKAIKLAPSDSLMVANYGRYLSYVGRAEEGIAQVKTAMRMSPDSLPLLYFLAANYRAAGKYDEAIKALIEHRKRLGGRILPAPTTQLIAALVQAGKTDDAKMEVLKLLKVAPKYSATAAATTHVYRDKADRDAFTAALILAGLPA